MGRADIFKLVIALIIGAVIGFSLGMTRAGKYEYSHFHGKTFRTDKNSGRWEISTEDGWMPANQFDLD